MADYILNIFKEHPNLALLFSICISVIIAVAGIIPSVFITSANILFFGFWKGMAISFLGEVVGAAVSFVLYRKGFKKVSEKPMQKFPKVKQLIEAKGKEAFLLLLSLRLIPFVPSGLITFAASIGKVSIAVFLLATLIGKAPALVIEAYSVYEVTQFSWQGKVILLLIACYLIYWAIKNNRKRKINN